MQIVATVNGEEISEKMLSQAVTRYIIQLEEEDENFSPTEENLRYLKVEALNSLIERLMLIQYAKREGIAVGEDEVAKRRTLLRSEYASEEEWEKNLTLFTINKDDLNSEIHNDLLIEKCLDRMFEANIEITENSLKTYYDENEKTMKEPDFFTFYEVQADGSEQAKQAALTLNSDQPVNIIRERLEAEMMELSHYADVPAYKLPPEVLNVLADLKYGQIGTMLIDDTNVVVYKLLQRKIGKPLVYDEIKEKLAKYLIESAKKDLYSLLVNGEMEKADIKYLDMAAITHK